MHLYADAAIAAGDVRKYYKGNVMICGKIRSQSYSSRSPRIKKGCNASPSHAAASVPAEAGLHFLYTPLQHSSRSLFDFF